MAKPRTNRQPIYGNYEVLSPEGALMFRCGQDKVAFYLDRDLAQRVGERIIQLTFQPNGCGHTELFYLEEKENRCVVCGIEKNLTRHHCIPYQYRKHFPVRFKKFSSHDVLPCCVSCHDTYERLADMVKKGIGRMFGCPYPEHRYINKDKLKACQYARSLANWRVYIPDDRAKQMLSVVAKYLGRPPTDEDIDYLGSLPRNNAFANEHYKSHGEAVVEHLDTDDKVVEFIRLWRMHFVNSMNPKYLSPFWDVDYVPQKVLET